MNDTTPLVAGRELDTELAARFAIAPDDWRRACRVHEHLRIDNDAWCKDCCGLVDSQPRVPECYSTDVAASEQIIELMLARGYACMEYRSTRGYGCGFITTAYAKWRFLTLSFTRTNL